MKRLSPILILLLLLAPFLAGCNQTGKRGDHAYRLAPLSQMPHEVRQAPASVREAYQFAVHNEDLLRRLPCTCGCAALGHTSNYACYVAGVDERGLPLYDNHAIDCRICVDITQDAMRLLDDGHTVAQIYAHVDATYGQFGPATPLGHLP